MAKQQQPLYQDNRLTISYWPNSVDDYQLIIKGKDGEETMQILQRGVLEELAKTPRERLEIKLDAINPILPRLLQKEEINKDWLHVALCQAHIEEEQRRESFASQMRAKSRA